MKFEDFKLLDFGHSIQISGMILSGPKADYLVALPGEDAIEFSDRPTEAFKSLIAVEFSASDWEKFLRQSDLLEVERTVGPIKAIVRKSQRQIDQAISWQVFRRDGFVCRYCGQERPLTVDHVIPWESGGPSVYDNLVAACKPCNKERGNMPYAVWLDSPEYKNRRVKLSPEGHNKNLVLALALPALAKLAVDTPAKRSR